MKNIKLLLEKEIFIRIISIFNDVFGRIYYEDIFPEET